MGKVKKIIPYFNWRNGVRKTINQIWVWGRES
jgi:hypothetical protein